MWLFLNVVIRVSSYLISDCLDVQYNYTGEHSIRSCWCPWYTNKNSRIHETRLESACILCSSAFSSYILKKYFKIKCTCMHLTSLLDQHKIFFQNIFIDAWAIWPKNSTDLENQLIWTKLLFAMVKIHCTRLYTK